ncbi:hypothetical protein BC936DRAFT_142320 [Jimgerdemannia flammicorona]|uniref:catechol O-methyltransferase n=1 Tax=Jimgerdemannia flammicorona TaxID=994334 RepID=A0A433DFA2_9FUNG|nr:hypothetical protein BC936DRAFT_142320 [Jimgerdemannia flammicorona]
MTQTQLAPTAVSLVKKEDSYLDHILAHAKRNNPESIIKETHKFAIERYWLMNVGPEKSPLVEQVLLEKRPKVAIEIGCYLGYSAIRFAAYIRDTLGIQDVKYYSFEISEYHANIARKVIDFAGLSHIITVITGPFNESLERLLSNHNLLSKVDFVFIDHHKELYKQDLQLLEKSGLFHTVCNLFRTLFYMPFSEFPRLLCPNRLALYPGHNHCGG